jgi:hypothetical protein
MQKTLPLEAQAGHTDTVKRLLKGGADIDEQCDVR